MSSTGDLRELSLCKASSGRDLSNMRPKPDYPFSLIGMQKMSESANINPDICSCCRQGHPLGSRKASWGRASLRAAEEPAGWKRRRPDLRAAADPPSPAAKQEMGIVPLLVPMKGIQGNHCMQGMHTTEKHVPSILLIAKPASARMIVECSGDGGRGARVNGCMW